jgi:hypothetical protein
MLCALIEEGADLQQRVRRPAERLVVREELDDWERRARHVVGTHLPAEMRTMWTESSLASALLEGASIFVTLGLERRSTERRLSRRLSELDKIVGELRRRREGH